MEDRYRSLEGYEGLSPLDKFGKFLMQNVRDEAIRYYEDLARGHLKAPSVASLQEELGSMSDWQRVIVWRCVRVSVDVAIGSFLFKLQEQADFENEIQVLVDGVNVVESSEALHWEPYGEDGWEAKYSAYGEAPEIA
jgi:hypothetical protein